MVNVTLTNMYIYCTVSKRTLPQWRITSADLPGIMFVEFFREKYLLAMNKYIMVIPARLHCVQGGAPDEKLKINKLEPYHNKESFIALWTNTQWSTMDPDLQETSITGFTTVEHGQRKVKPLFPPPLTTQVQIWLQHL